MKIIVDKEGKEAVMQLCDIALKQGGINILTGIQNILSSIEELSVNEDINKEVKK